VPELVSDDRSVGMIQTNSLTRFNLFILAKHLKKIKTYFFNSISSSLFELSFFI